MKSSSDQFKQGVDKAFSTINLNPTTMSDALKLKSTFNEENELEGGLADKDTLLDIAMKHAFGDKVLTTGKKIEKLLKTLKKQLKKGIEVEMEHTNDKGKAKEIAMDHLKEDPNYYTKLSKVENNEATGSGSSGQYSGPVFGGDDEFWRKSKEETPTLDESTDGEKIEATEATGSGSSGTYETPAAWAKSTSKKDWGGRKKTQYPGGTFVSVKKKCSKFPYCNKGDINALNLSKNESVAEAIKTISQRTGLKESYIQAILEHEYEKINKR